MTPVQHHQHGDGPCYGYEALYHHGKAVVKGFADGIHIVGKTAHQFPVGMGVKVGQGKALGVPEQIGPDFVHHLLGNVDHHLIVGITGECAAQVQPSHDQQHVYKPRYVTRENETVDDWF